jgi:hypothetical protein
MDFGFQTRKPLFSEFSFIFFYLNKLICIKKESVPDSIEIFQAISNERIH